MGYFYTIIILRSSWFTQNRLVWLRQVVLRGSTCILILNRFILLISEKELILCHNLWISNSYIFVAQCCKPQTFQIMNSDQKFLKFLMSNIKFSSNKICWCTAEPNSTWKYNFSTFVDWHLPFINIWRFEILS